jgi:hypothetical protein
MWVRMKLLWSCTKTNLNGLGFLQMKKIHVYPSELQMMESMAICEALKKVNILHWYYQSSHTEENENHYAILCEENAPKLPPKWWHVHRIVS